MRFCWQINSTSMRYAAPRQFSFWVLNFSDVDFRLSNVYPANAQGQNDDHVAVEEAFAFAIEALGCIDSVPELVI